MEFRSPKYTGDGRIDCEIEHPVYGWIPFTASPNDVEELGRNLHAEILASGRPISPADPPGGIAGPSVKKRQWDWMLRRYELDTKVSSVLEYLRENDREEYAALMDKLDFADKFYLSEAVAIVDRLSPVLVLMGHTVPSETDITNWFNSATLWTGAPSETQETP